jgi:hypothetical protein
MAKNLKLPTQQPPPPSPFGTPPPALIPAGALPPGVPPTTPVPNTPLDTSTLPISPINWRAHAEALLGAHGVKVKPDGSLVEKQSKELKPDVVTLAQSLYTPSMMSLPPIRPITNQAINTGVAPVMSNNKTPWGKPQTK